MSEQVRRDPGTAKVLAAFAAVYVVWGSTYLAIRVAIESLPPLLMAGTRFLLAGAVLYAFMRLRGEPAPERRHWRSAAIIGAALLVGGNGLVVLAERTVPSGVAALLVAVVPLFMVVLEWLRPRGTRPTRRVIVGLVVGFAGMVLLVGPGSLGGGAVDLLGAGMLVFASLSWAAGSLYARGASLPKSPFLATGMEMAAGGVMLLVAGLLRGEWATVDPSAFTGRSVGAFFYLVVFGSLVGFTAYIWLLGVSTPARVSTYAYVNPVVAVFLGWALADEPLSARVLLAAATIVAAVAVITMGKRTPPAVPDEAAEDTAAPAERPRRRPARAA